VNNILLLSELVISFASLIILYYKYQKQGLYTWIVIALFLSNIMITKTISLSGVDINLGIITDTTIFIAMNIIIQKEGREEVNKILLLITITSLFSYMILCITTLTNISSISSSIDKSYNNLFLNNISIYLAHTISLLIALKINAHIYYKIKMLENRIWLSNIISMIASQLIYEIIFSVIYLTYQNTIINIIMIAIIRFILSIFTQTTGTLIIYFSNNNIKERNKNLK
jgi:uncharacterized integral membrane protein (TIGR00697 family)